MLVPILVMCHTCQVPSIERHQFHTWSTPSAAVFKMLWWSFCNGYKGCRKTWQKQATGVLIIAQGCPVGQNLAPADILYFKLLMNLSVSSPSQLVLDFHEQQLLKIPSRGGHTESQVDEVCAWGRWSPWTWYQDSLSLGNWWVTEMAQN